MTSGYDACHQTSVGTATPEQLVVMLFDGAIRFGRRGIQALSTGDRAAGTHQIRRVSAIVSELDNSLDMELGGEIATNLHAIYSFASRLLLEAALHGDAPKVRQVIELLQPLRDAFAEIAREVRAA